MSRAPVGDSLLVAPAASAPQPPPSTPAAAAPAAPAPVALKMYPAAAPAAKYCLAEQELRSEAHASELCGAKTNNLLALRKLLPDSVSTPASAVIPFGTLAKTLADAANAAGNAAYVAAVAAVRNLPQQRLEKANKVLDLFNKGLDRVGAGDSVS